MTTDSISGRTNLAKFKHAIVDTKSGDKAIVIPVKANNLFLSDAGNLFFDWIGWPKKSEDKDGNTHLIKQSIPKDVLATMSEQEKKDLPIFGNLKPFSGKGESAAVSDPATAESVADVVDGLPF